MTNTDEELRKLAEDVFEYATLEAYSIDPSYLEECFKPKLVHEVFTALKSVRDKEREANKQAFEAMYEAVEAAYDLIKADYQEPDESLGYYVSKTAEPSWGLVCKALELAKRVKGEM